MKRYCKYVWFLCWLLPFTVTAQQEDITGLWKGELVMTDTAGELVSLPYEIAVSEEKGKLIGFSRIVFRANGKEEAGIQDFTIKRKGKEIVMEDEGFIQHQFSINPSRRVKKTMIVKLTVEEKEMILEGTWSTNRTRIYTPAKGSVILKRKNDFKKSELFKSLDTLNLVAKLSFKDRPETLPAVAVATPVEKKPEPVIVTAPVPEPELVIPALEKVRVTTIPVVKKPQSSTANISAPSKQQKMRLDALAKSTLKPPAPKPEPVVAAAPAPKPAVVTAAPSKPVQKPAPPPVSKPEPVVAKVVPEKKPAEVPAKSVPKPTPPPIAVVAPSVVQGAAEIDKRITKSDQAFYFESDSLLLTLYDNGEVDGDTVTVLMNGNVIFSKVGLNTKPNSKTIYITENMDSVKLVMYAESLGEIPPNTGLLIVNDGEKRYDVRFSADLKTNAAIVLRRKKNE